MAAAAAATQARTSNAAWMTKLCMRPRPDARSARRPPSIEFCRRAALIPHAEGGVGCAHAKPCEARSCCAADASRQEALALRRALGQFRRDGWSDQGQERAAGAGRARSWRATARHDAGILHRAAWVVDRHTAA